MVNKDKIQTVSLSNLYHPNFNGFSPNILKKITIFAI